MDIFRVKFKLEQSGKMPDIGVNFNFKINIQRRKSSGFCVWLDEGEIGPKVKEVRKAKG